MFTHSKEIFQSIFEESPIGKEIFDAAGELKDINRSCLNIFGISEIPRIMKFNLFSDPNIPESEKEKLRRGKTVRCECPFDFEKIKQRGLYQTSRSGAAIIDLIISPLKKNGKIMGFLAQLQDITAQKDLEETLTRAYRELHQTQEIVMQQERLRIMGQIASGIAHDISNHLVPIIGHLDLLLNSDETLPAPLQEKYEAIQIAATDIASTIDRLRDFYRLQKQGEISSINLNVIIGQAINLTRFRWKNETQRHGRVIEIRQDLQPDLPQFSGVESEIRDALINLMLNAIDAIPQHGSITLKSRFRDSQVILEVEDTGQGMDEETLRHCLEPFFTTKGLRGSGLGLVMVKGTMERYRGKVEMTSQPGEGTRAKLYFPYQKALEATCPEPRELSAEPYPLHILYVEDEPAVQAVTRKMLERDGHQVVLAGDGQTALATLFFGQHRRRPFDLVITDLGMPFMNGYELTAQIKIEYPEMPVAILTGWESFPMDDEEKSQADFLLNKPIRLEKLRELIREVISRKKPVGNGGSPSDFIGGG
jgi:PAS domain S-box-containing protein